MLNSKPIGGGDESGKMFAQEMLAGDVTYGINFDRVQWDKDSESWVIIELLKTDPGQRVTPHTSHPNWYFHKNSRKFLSLWHLAQALKAKLYLVNYTNKDAEHADKVLLMEVDDVDPQTTSVWRTMSDGRQVKNIVRTRDARMTRAEYSAWFRALNKRGNT